MSDTLPAPIPATLPVPFERATLAPADAHLGDEMLEELARIYTASVAEAEDPDRPGDPDGFAFDPAEDTLRYFLDSYTWGEGEMPTVEGIAAWAEEHADEINGGLPLARHRIRRGRLADAYHDLRREGKTTVEIARKLKTTPIELAGAFKGEGFMEEDRTRATRITLAAQHEHEAHRAAVARRRMLGQISAKLERELKARDLSDLPTKDLAGLLLKLAEISRDEPSPRLGVKASTSY